jgi:AraC-like DNA-binding protein
MLWYCRAPDVPYPRERVLPNGCIQLVVNLSRDYLTDCGADGMQSGRVSRALIVGARTRFETVDTGDMEELAGIVVEPGGFAGFFHERADLFFERSIALEDVWRPSGIVDRLQEAPTPAAKLGAIDGLLIRLVDRAVDRRALIDHSICLFRSERVSVGECARQIGVSTRRLSQVFREEVGMGPKAWSRVQRFQAALGALRRKTEVPWVELALECGYYDQSHFANDFKAFSGIDPTTYSAQRGRWQNHVPVL